MKIGILGINHKSAELSLREKLARACERLFGTGPTYYLHPLFSYVLLSTCNRTEIYFQSDDPAETHTYILNAIRHEIKEEFEHKIYAYFGSDCFLHLACVTAGIDSALIGETEIQGQVKRAYETASQHHHLDAELHFLFQKCLKIGKNIRTKAQFEHLAPSMEEAVINQITDMFGAFTNKKILFVGLSEINLKILSHLKKRGLSHITLCNRTPHKTTMHVLPWENLSLWHAYDIIIFGTKCPHYLIRKNQIPPLHSQKLLIDLSVPRNVEPCLSAHPFIRLINVDQIALDRKSCEKATEVAKLETQHISQAVEKQMTLFRLRELQKAAHLLSHAS